MVLGSRFIPTTFSEVKIDSVSHVQQSEETAHYSVRIFEGTHSIRQTHRE